MSLKPFLEFNFEEKEDRLYLANSFIYTYSLSIGKNNEHTFANFDLYGGTPSLKSRAILENYTIFNITEVINLPFKEIVHVVNEPLYEVYATHMQILFLLFYLFNKPLKLKPDSKYFIFVNGTYDIDLSFVGNSQYAYRLYSSEQWYLKDYHNLSYFRHYISFKISNNTLILL